MVHLELLGYVNVILSEVITNPFYIPIIINFPYYNLNTHKFHYHWDIKYNLLLDFTRNYV